jgi:hypothetical protein
MPYSNTFRTLPQIAASLSLLLLTGCNNTPSPVNLGSNPQPPVTNVPIYVFAAKGNRILQEPVANVEFGELGKPLVKTGTDGTATFIASKVPYDLVVIRRSSDAASTPSSIQVLYGVDDTELKTYEEDYTTDEKT